MPKGRMLDKVIEELSRKIEQELLDKAPLIPPAQRPKVKTRKKYVLPQANLVQQTMKK